MDRQTSPGRLAIIAGGGVLPRAVAVAACETGEHPLIIPLIGENDDDWQGFDHQPLGTGDFAGLKRLFAAHGISRVVMSGWVRRRPLFTDIRPTLSTLKRVPGILKRLAAGGDNSVLAMVIDLIEAEGVAVVGVQDIVPGLVSGVGVFSRRRPDDEALANIKIASEAARLIGSLDIGQGAVAVGGRVVALEGPEGTDRMMARVAELREEGRISKTAPGVLVKLCKPGQDRRVDLPAIGPSTIANAKAAGLTGIAVEAGRSLVLNGEETRALADRDGLFLVGLEPQTPEPRP